VRRVTNQHHAAENRVLLINFHDWDTARLSGLIKQVGDRLAKIVEVVAPI